MRPDLSIVIPVYRSAATLPILVDRLMRVLGSLGRPFEVVLVDDGSPDHSWEVLTGLQEAHPDHLVAVQLMRNFGQHNALMCGFRHARGKYVVTMDDDLQNPPEEVPRLLEAIEASGLDLVYGRYGTKRHHPLRNCGSAAANAFFRVVIDCPVKGTAFRIMRRELVQSLLPYSLNFTYIDGLLAWSTRRIGDVPVEHHARSEGRSGYSPGKLVLMSLNLLTNFSLLPLQLVSAAGFLVAGVGLASGFYYLLQYLFSNIEVPGYASIIVAVLILGGIQLLSLGVMGEYLGRLHLNVNRKPQYVERRLLAGRAPADLQTRNGLATAGRLARQTTVDPEVRP